MMSFFDRRVVSNQYEKEEEMLRIPTGYGNYIQTNEVAR